MRPIAPRCVRVIIRSDKRFSMSFSNHCRVKMCVCSAYYQMQLSPKPRSIMANNRKEHNCGTRTARAAFRAVCGLRSEDLGVTAPRIGRGHGDCAPCPSHTTGRAVFRIRRLDTAGVADAPPRSPTAWQRQVRFIVHHLSPPRRWKPDSGRVRLDRTGIHRLRPAAPQGWLP